VLICVCVSMPRSVWRHGAPVTSPLRDRGRGVTTDCFLFGCAPAWQDPERCEKIRSDLELWWSVELTMLASLGAEVLMLAVCAVGGGCGAEHLAGGAEG
jgi:hypothetical protein